MTTEYGHITGCLKMNTGAFRAEYGQSEAAECPFARIRTFFPALAGEKRALRIRAENGHVANTGGIRAENGQNGEQGRAVMIELPEQFYAAAIRQPRAA